MSEHDIDNQTEGKKPFPLSEEELGLYNSFVERINEWYEEASRLGQSPSLPPSINPLVVRSLTEMHVPPGAPPLGLEDVHNVLEEEDRRQVQLVQFGQDTFHRLALGAHALALSHGTSLDSVAGYTDIADTTRGPQRSIREIIPSLHEKAEAERTRYRVLSWALKPLKLAGRSVPQNLIIRSTREVGVSEIALYSYELEGIDQIVSEEEQGRRERRGKSPVEAGFRISALFNEETNEVQGLSITWDQLPERKTNDKAFIGFLEEKAPVLATFVKSTMVRPDWVIARSVSYSLQINFGHNGLHAEPPSVSIARRFTKVNAIYGGGEDPKTITENEAYVYDPRKEIDQFTPINGNNTGRTISPEEYKLLLGEVKEIFPKDIIRV